MIECAKQLYKQGHYVKAVTLLGSEKSTRAQFLQLKCLMYIIAEHYHSRRRKGYYFTPLDFHEMLFIRTFRRLVKEQKDKKTSDGQLHRIMLFQAFYQHVLEPFHIPHAYSQSTKFSGILRHFEMIRESLNRIEKQRMDAILQTYKQQPEKYQKLIQGLLAPRQDPPKLPELLKLDRYNSEYFARLESSTCAYTRAKTYFAIGKLDMFSRFYDMCNQRDQLRLQYQAARKNKDIAQLKDILKNAHDDAKLKRKTTRQIGKLMMLQGKTQIYEGVQCLKAAACQLNDAKAGLLLAKYYVFIYRKSQGVKLLELMGGLFKMQQDKRGECKVYMTLLLYYQRKYERKGNSQLVPLITQLVEKAAGTCDAKLMKRNAEDLEGEQKLSFCEARAAEGGPAKCYFEHQCNLLEYARGTRMENLKFPVTSLAAADFAPRLRVDDLYYFIKAFASTVPKREMQELVGRFKNVPLSVMVDQPGLLSQEQRLKLYDHVAVMLKFRDEEVVGAGEKLAALANNFERRACDVCYEEEFHVSFIKCRHSVCLRCLPKLERKNCHICREEL